MTYTLTLTADEAEILGYALTIALRDQRAKAEAAKPNGIVREGCLERAARIEEVRNLLDTCPVTAE